MEQERLEQTIALAQKQLDDALKRNEENREAIIEAKKELHENTSHSIANLWSSDAFEALAELNQYANPVTDKIASYEEVENQIAILKNIIKCPYFARIDFKFEDEEEYENIYIGRSSLKKDNTYNMFVYDWRSPIASVFYRFVTGPAFYDAPSGRIAGELNLKRQFEIKEGKLEYYFDADVQIVDEFLRKLLSQNSSTQMKAIVETIQRDQDVIIRDMENDLMMVQGVAGSGKTSIALHRAAYLMYKGLSSKLSANNILILSPNTLFEQYISSVLPELGEEHVTSMVFEELCSAVLKTNKIQTRNEFLENLISSSRYKKIMKDSVEFKTSQSFFEILQVFIQDLPQKWIPFEDVYFEGKWIIGKEILKEKILTRKETPLGVKLKQLEEFVIEKINDSRQVPLKKSEEFEAIAEIQKFTLFDVFSLYRKLFEDRSYFYTLAKNISLPDNIEEILSFTKDNTNTNLWYYDDAIALTYLQLKINGSNNFKNIKQVVIDEAQDYYPLHFEIIHLLFANSKFTVLGDINQTLEKKEDLKLYNQISKILNKPKSTLVTMDKSFRCTSEILAYSSKFLEQNLEVKSFNRSGSEPETYVCKSNSDLKDKIFAEIAICLEKGYGSIGLICKTQRNTNAIYSLLKEKINLQLITTDSTEALQGIFAIPVYMSKGLEFDAVLICDAGALNYQSEEDKKLLYIGCTRALHRLNLFAEGELSPLLY